MNTTPALITPQIERQIIDRLEREKRRSAGRRGPYNVLRPGDERFTALPLEQQWARVVRIEATLTKRLRALREAKAAIAAAARKKGIVLRTEE